MEEVVLSRDEYGDQNATRYCWCVSTLQDTSTVHVVYTAEAHAHISVYIYIYIYTSIWACFLRLFYNPYNDPLNCIPGITTNHMWMMLYLSKWQTHGVVSLHSTYRWQFSMMLFLWTCSLFIVCMAWTHWWLSILR